MDPSNNQPATHVSYDGDNYNVLYPIYRISGLETKDPEIAFTVPGRGARSIVKRKINVKNPSYKAYRMIMVDSIASDEYENDIVFERYDKSKIQDAYQQRFEIDES